MRGHTSQACELYAEFDLPIVLVAVNTGWFWPRTGLRRSPGKAVLEVLEVLPPRRNGPGLLEEIEQKIEAGAQSLAAEAATYFEASKRP